MLISSFFLYCIRLCVKAYSPLSSDCFPFKDLHTIAYCCILFQVKCGFTVLVTKTIYL